MNKIIAWGCAVALLTGCTTTSDSTRTTAEGAGFGAAIGAVAGGIIGHQTGSGVEGAIIGGLIGGGAGALYGNHVAGKKEKYASEEEYLTACLDEARNVEEAARTENAALRADIEQLDEQAQALLAAYAADEAKRDDIMTLRKEVEARLAKARSSLQQVDEEIAIQREVLVQEKDSGAEQLAQLEAEIQKLETQQAELTQQTDRLASISSRMSV